MNKTVLILSMSLAVASQAAISAELQSGDQLTIDEGSSFSFGGGPVFLIGEDGLTVGLSLGDTGAGSHGGAPNGSEGGAVTQPWLYFCNTGYDYLSATTGSGSFGGSTESGVDMSSWTATWNGIPSIILGGCFHVPGGCDIDNDGIDDIVDTGVGEFVWSGDYGDNYTITYTTHLPIGDPTGFGGVRYDLFLTGHVIEAGAPLPPTVGITINIAGGVTYECNEGGSTIMASATVRTTDNNDIVSIAWLVNGETVQTGDSVETFVPLGDNELTVEVKTLASGTVAKTVMVLVQDTKNPIIDAAFVSSQTGEEITVLSDGVKSALQSGNITVVYSATDACDANPVAEATLGIDVASGDKIKLNRGKNNLMLQGDLLSDSVVLNVTARDQSGRRAVLKKTLER